MLALFANRSRVDVSRKPTTPRDCSSGRTGSANPRPEILPPILWYRNIPCPRGGNSCRGRRTGRRMSWAAWDIVHEDGVRVKRCASCGVETRDRRASKNRFAVSTARLSTRVLGRHRPANSICVVGTLPSKTKMPSQSTWRSRGGRRRPRGRGISRAGWCRARRPRATSRRRPRPAAAKLFYDANALGGDLPSSRGAAAETSVHLRRHVAGPHRGHRQRRRVRAAGHGMGRFEQLPGLRRFAVAHGKRAAGGRGRGFRR